MRILFIDIDSLRPDHLSCYGYHRNTSPNIDGVAAEGVRFTNYYATDTPCLPSRTALFSGQFGVRTGVVNHGGEFADPAVQGVDRGFRADAALNSFANMLRRGGYHTASISPFPARHTAYQIWYGFSEMHDTGGNGLDNADHVYPYAERWLAANGQDDNWFLHVNFWDPHTPYDHPESFGNPFENEPIEDWITQELLDRQNASFGPHSATEVAGITDTLPPAAKMGVGRVRTRDDAKAHLDGYDTGIRFADYYVGKIIDRPHGPGNLRRDGHHHHLRPRRKPGGAQRVGRSPDRRPVHEPDSAGRALARRDGRAGGQGAFRSVLPYRPACDDC